MYGERLRLLRKVNRLTMEEVGKRLGIAKSSYAGYESESRMPPLDKLQKLAQMYDVSTDYILGITEDPDPKQDRRDIKQFFEKDQLHWNGRPLSEDELEPIRKLLEIVVRDRMPEKVKQAKENHNKVIDFNGNTKNK
jgi:transcriptional regulator with XRE-family HTH domain